MYMLIKAAMQLLLMVAELGVVGHCATCRFEPAKPPMRVWISHIPDGEPESEERFHWIRIAPAVAPWVDTIMSLHSTMPVSSVFPTLTTGWGELMEEKKDPAPIIMG